MEERGGDCKEGSLKMEVEGKRGREVGRGWRKSRRIER